MTDVHISFFYLINFASTIFLILNVKVILILTMLVLDTAIRFTIELFFNKFNFFLNINTNWLSIFIYLISFPHYHDALIYWNS